jgi:sedoheptulokinase
MAEELKSMYQKNPKHTIMIGSGNGLRKNKALQLLFSKSFGMQLKIPSHNEEASFGAALFGMTAAGLCKDISQAQKLIKYI